jgi:hypothetical protein
MAFALPEQSADKLNRACHKRRERATLQQTTPAGQSTSLYRISAHAGVGISLGSIEG